MKRLRYVGAALLCFLVPFVVANLYGLLSNPTSAAVAVWGVLLVVASLAGFGFCGYFVVLFVRSFRHPRTDHSHHRP